MNFEFKDTRKKLFIFILKAKPKNDKKADPILTFSISFEICLFVKKIIISNWRRILKNYGRYGHSEGEFAIMAVCW